MNKIKLFFIKYGKWILYLAVAIVLYLTIIPLLKLLKSTKKFNGGETINSNFEVTNVRNLEQINQDTLGIAISKAEEILKKLKPKKEITN